MEEIAAAVYVSAVYPGINVGFILTDEGAVAVDAPPVPAEARVWRNQILEVAGGTIRQVVLTDDHPDRLMGLAWLEAPVIAGRGTLERLRDGGEALWQATVASWARYHPGVKGLDGARLIVPEVGVDGCITVHGSEPVIVETVAGAAPGSVWARFPRQAVLFAGDTVVVGSHPPLAEAPDTAAWLKTLVELRRARFPARLVVPGRGPLSKKQATSALSDYIQRARRRIRSVHNAGGSLSELAGLVSEFLPLFPVAEEEQEMLQHQIRAGLERLFEELRPEQPER